MCVSVCVFIYLSVVNFLKMALVRKRERERDREKIEEMIQQFESPTGVQASQAIDTRYIFWPTIGLNMSISSTEKKRKKKRKEVKREENVIEDTIMRSAFCLSFSGVKQNVLFLAGSG